MEENPNDSSENIERPITSLKYLDGKRVLVTGACGTVGSELVRQLLENDSAGELVCVDNNESELFFLEQRFSSYANARYYLGDVRDQDKLMRLMAGVDVVLHTAAFKHVILCERTPFEAVRTNIIGVQNLIIAAVQNKVEKVIFTSSDKAVNPTNVMGTSKLMGERLMTAANSNSNSRLPLFTSTRFGNVLGSRGSVIPIFREQIRKGGPVTLTDPEMTRFIMSIEEAVRMILESGAFARGGEVFITKMPVIRIKDLARVMIDELAAHYGRRPENIEIRTIGAKPSEKMFEELMNVEEMRRSVELERYFVVLPAYTSIHRSVEYFYPDEIARDISLPYNSANQNSLSIDELRSFLLRNNLLREAGAEEYQPAERYWPDGV